MKKHEQKSKAQIIAMLKKQKADEELLRGMLANQMITIWLLWKSYEWDKPSLIEWWELQKKWMAHYAFKKMNGDDIQDMIGQIRDELGIDLTDPKILTEDMCEDE